MSATDIAAAFFLGIAGAGHCLGMCGGIAVGLQSAAQSSGLVTCFYHLGRISSYMLLGVSLGVVAGISDMHLWAVSLRYVAGLLLVGMGLYVTRWWMGMAILERWGSVLWRPVRGLAGRWLPVRSWSSALALGLCWGLMPCGLIYSSLAWSATAADPLASGLLMFCFGLGTLPAMLSASFGGGYLYRLLRKDGFRTFVGIGFIISGVWTVYMAAAHGAHAGHDAMCW